MGKLCCSPQSLSLQYHLGQFNFELVFGQRSLDFLQQLLCSLLGFCPKTFDTETPQSLQFCLEIQTQMTIKTPSLFSSGEASGEADEGGIPGADPSRSHGELDVPGFDTIGPSGVETGEGFSAGDTFESFGSDQFCSEPVFGVMDESTLDSLVAESADGSEGQQHEILDEELYPPGDVNAAGSQTQPSGPTDSFVDVDLDSCVNAALISITFATA